MSGDRLPTAAYERAERMLGHNRSRLVLRADVKPRWIGDGTRFWYRVDTERGNEFIVVDPARGVREPAFDHERLARSLTAAGGTPVEPYALPFREIRVGRREIGFDAFDAAWVCRLPDHSVRRDGPASSNPSESVSPDHDWVAFRREHDLWLRAAASGDEWPATTGGSADLGYGIHADTNSNRQVLSTLDTQAPPLVLWSPDSARVLTHATDQTTVPPLHLVESSPAEGGRPRLHTYRYPMPGEPVAMGEWLIIDVRRRTTVRIAERPFVLAAISPIQLKKVWWSDDGTTVYFLDQPRDMRTLRLTSIDAATGHVRTLIEESGDTRVEASQEMMHAPLVRVLSDGGAALWYSQRDGWGHLYLCDLGTGRTIRQVTKGEFAVQDILHVDEENRVAYLAVSGLVAADPYHRSLASVGLDGGDIALLTGDGLDHRLFAPGHGRWFVDSASTVDTPPVTAVRGRDGAVLLELERADISRLLEHGWTPPERIATTAADGTTEIYGVLYKPFGFDPGRRYPVVDHVYPGPQMRRVEASFDPGWRGHEAEAVAALGFAVVALDGRGTPGRDKAFHDHSYRNLGSCGALDDHVTALHQLAETRPWLDLDLVGIFGRSGGGFAAARALMAFPDLYKVGVAEAGNHDNRQYQAAWAETYDGPFDPDSGARLSNTELVENLTGKLLLIHGEMDDNVTPYLTLRLVDRLIAADKDFDLLIIPGAEHRFVGYGAYVTRRRWDYLVRHLMRREPPAYRLAPIPVSPDQLEFVLGEGAAGLP
jgi:dipeptidyl-peptidase 4